MAVDAVDYKVPLHLDTDRGAAAAPDRLRATAALLYFNKTAFCCC